MAFIESAVLAEFDSNFRRRVKVAIEKVAQAVVGEAEQPGKDNLNSKRHDLGSAIMENPELKLEAFVWAVIANPAITGSSTDADIEFTVISVFNDIAKVKNSEL